MAHWTGQLYVSHTFPPYFGPGYLDAALVADNAFVADLFVLATETLVILGRAKDFLSE